MLLVKFIFSISSQQCSQRREICVCSFLFYHLRCLTQYATITTKDTYNIFVEGFRIECLMLGFPGKNNNTKMIKILHSLPKIINL